jgi:DNA/RNA-binding domain of Phe-tRNA-synthetase-like protein
MISFQYHPDIFAAYPSLVGGVIVASGLRNGPTPPALQAAYLDEQKAVIARIGSTPLSEIPSLAAWRGVFRSFKVDPTQYRSAAESLLRRLTKKGDIPSINVLVDLGNLVSIRYGLPVAVFDLRAIQRPITVHFADGSERFTTLNQAEVEHPEVGEVVFSDATKLGVARRWCWRQSEESASREDTHEAVITVEGHHAEALADVRSALDDVLALLKQYAGGDYQSALLGSAKTLTQPALGL